MRRPNPLTAEEREFVAMAYANRGEPVPHWLDAYECPRCRKVMFGNGARTSHIRWHARQDAKEATDER